MFRLIFKILADAAGFNRTLKTEMPATAKQGGKLAGKAAGDEMGKVMGAQIKAGIMRYLGAGALLGTVTKFATDAAEIVKGAMQGGLSTDAYQELKKAMEQTGMSMQELQEKAALAPAEFTKLMETIRANGGIIPQDAIDGLAKTKELMDGMKSDSMVGIFKLLDALRQAWYGLHAGLGATYETIGAATGSYGLLARGSRFKKYADEGAEKMVGMPSIVSGASSPAADFIRASKREKPGDIEGWWGDIGGNVDWSGQSKDRRDREVEAEKVAKAIREEGEKQRVKTDLLIETIKRKL